MKFVARLRTEIEEIKTSGCITERVISFRSWLINDMKIKMLATILPLAFGVKASAQSVHFTSNLQLDMGTGIPVSGNKTGWKNSQYNQNYAVAYYSWKQYQNLPLRVRATFSLETPSGLQLGIQSGGTYHYGESYGSAKYHVLSIPVQMRIIKKIWDLTNGSLSTDAAAGIRVFKLTSAVRQDKTGPVLSLGAVLQKKEWLLRAGGEYQADNGTYQILDEPLNGVKAETVHYTTKRIIFYLAIGTKLKLH